MLLLLCTMQWVGGILGEEQLQAVAVAGAGLRQGLESLGIGGQGVKQQEQRLMSLLEDRAHAQVCSSGNMLLYM
jgi:hypothetical protein